MDKGSPCLGCNKRRAEHGYNCHSDCPDILSITRGELPSVSFLGKRECRMLKLKA